VVGETEDRCAACGSDGKPCCGTGNSGTCSTGLACSDRSLRNGTPGTCGVRQVDAGAVVARDAPSVSTTEAGAGEVR
jgi:hypothetical protein